MKKLLCPLMAVLLASCATAPKSTPPTTAPAMAAPAATTAAPVPYWPADGIFPGKGHVSSWKDFKKHNADRRALFAAHRDQDQDALVFVGDSITEGWHTLTQDFADIGVKVVNRGIGGDTTPNLLYRLDDDVISLHPRALVILIGTNDLGEHTSPEDIVANLRDLHTRIRTAFPSIPIAWCLVMPRKGEDTYPQRIKQLNALIEEMVRSDAKITICDTYTPLAQPDGTSIPADFNPDRLHLNAKGYAVWRGALHPIVASWNLAANAQ